MDKGKKWTIVLLVAILLINIYQNIKISELQKKVKNQEYGFTRMREDI